VRVCDGGEFSMRWEVVRQAWGTRLVGMHGMGEWWAEKARCSSLNAPWQRRAGSRR